MPEKSGEGTPLQCGREESKEPRPSRRGFCKPRGNVPPLRYGLPFLPALPSGASWQILVKGKGGRPDDSLCSRNARPRKALVGRAHVGKRQTTPPILRCGDRRGPGQSAHTGIDQADHEKVEWASYFISETKFLALQFVMSLDLAHEKLGWPSPEEIRNPSGEGARIFAGLAQAKIGRAISLRPDASDVKIGVLSRNSHTAATEAPLAVVAEFNGQASDNTLRALHHLAWNFSHSPTVVTIESNLLRVWTCCEPPEERLLSEYVVKELSTNDLTTSHPSDITKRATQALHWVNLVSGQFFRDHTERFQRDRRADQMLLGNLQYVRHILHQTGLVDDDICHDLLARIIFVQFLFDRKDSIGNSALNRSKLVSLLEGGILQKEHADFPSILEDYEETYRLFDWLNDKFNGDLFPSKSNSPQERARSWRKERDRVKPKHLRLLRDFVKGDMDMPRGQLCLWPKYAFDAIPLEFISSIYEAFVSERASGEGIYYTPPHLVDFILDRVLPWDSAEWDLKVLDPACGSGVFLVKAFKRLIHRWKKAHPSQTIRAETLRGMLEKTCSA